MYPEFYEQHVRDVQRARRARAAEARAARARLARPAPAVRMRRAREGLGFRLVEVGLRLLASPAGPRPDGRIR